MSLFKVYFKIRNLKRISRIDCRFSSSSLNVNFLNRDLINPDHLSTADVKAILWTAESMKTLRTPSELLNGRHVTLLATRPNFRFQVAFERAAQDLGAQCTTCVVSDYPADACSDYGRLVSSLTDVIVTHGMPQYQVEEFAEGSGIPVINASSDIFCQMKALTDLLTLLKVLGPLKRQCLAWVGPPTALCNTYIYLAPKLKLDLRLFCICPNGNGDMSAVKLDHAMSRCRGQSQIQECSSAEEAVYRADVIACAEHHVPQHCLTAKILEEAALDWYLLHGLPRSGCEVSKDVFRHKNNLTWLSAKNTKFIAMALLLRVLKPYEPDSPIPDFDGPP